MRPFDGSRILRETSIVPSPHLPEILPSVLSALLIEDLSHRVIVDDWLGNFASTQRAVETWRAHGWRISSFRSTLGRTGVTTLLPDVLPANESMGATAAW